MPFLPQFCFFLISCLSFFAMFLPLLFYYHPKINFILIRSLFQSGDYRSSKLKLFSVKCSLHALVTVILLLITFLSYFPQFLRNYYLFCIVFLLVCFSPLLELHTRRKKNMAQCKVEIVHFLFLMSVYLRSHMTVDKALKKSLRILHTYNLKVTQELQLLSDELSSLDRRSDAWDNMLMRMGDTDAFDFVRILEQFEKQGADDPVILENMAKFTFVYTDQEVKVQGQKLSSRASTLATILSLGSMGVLFYWFFFK